MAAMPVVFGSTLTLPVEEGNALASQSVQRFLPEAAR